VPADATALARRAWLRAGLVAVGVIIVDQASKAIIVHSIQIGEERKVLPGLQFVHSQNRGVAFGLFPNSPGIVIALILLALAALVIYFARHATTPLIWLPTGMLIGGALGNIIDRLRHGSVTDFVKLPLGWPPFNLADTMITLGIIGLFLVVEHSRTRESPGGP
jgi:signal peptidase II